MKVWVTKHALTRGIYANEAVQIDTDGVAWIEADTGSGRDFLMRPQWRKTRKEAVARAKEMRTAKIASLKEQIARLEALRFEEAKP